jgi:hypothetical protein
MHRSEGNGERLSGSREIRKRPATYIHGEDKLN